MALTDTGQRVSTLEGTNAKATDGEGATVIVSASDEAISDCGWGAIFEAASRKLETGQSEPDSNPPLVRVHKADCDDA